MEGLVVMSCVLLEFSETIPFQQCCHLSDCSLQCNVLTGLGTPNNNTEGVLYVFTRLWYAVFTLELPCTGTPSDL